MAHKIVAYLSLTLLAVTVSCKKKNNTSVVEPKVEEKIVIEETTKPNTIPNPMPNEKLHILKEVIGDLDNDNIPEKVTVINTSEWSDKGIEREIQFFKKGDNDTWVLWKKTREGILQSRMGGVLGDPFRGIDIKNGVFTIQHSGGSRTKWETLNKYRYQNGNFELIGYTQQSKDPCINSLLIDYNLSTGNAILQRAKVTCKNYKPVSKEFTINKKVNYKTSPLPHLHDGKSSDIITPLLKAANAPKFFG